MIVDGCADIGWHAGNHPMQFDRCPQLGATCSLSDPVKFVATRESLPERELSRFDGESSRCGALVWIFLVRAVPFRELFGVCLLHDCLSFVKALPQLGWALTGLGWPGAGGGN